MRFPHTSTTMTCPTLRISTGLKLARTPSGHSHPSSWWASFVAGTERRQRDHLGSAMRPTHACGLPRTCRPFVSPEESYFNYSNTGYVLLGRVLEQAHRRYTGAFAPLREILHECVFKRAGMTNTELGMQVAPLRSNDDREGGN